MGEEEDEVVQRNVFAGWHAGVAAGWIARSCFAGGGAMITLLLWVGLVMLAFISVYEEREHK